MGHPSSVHISDQTHAQRQATDAEGDPLGLRCSVEGSRANLPAGGAALPAGHSHYASEDNPDGHNPRAPRERTAAGSVGLTLWWDFGHRRRRTGILSQNKLDHVAVGDPDPTADASMTDGYRACWFEWTDETSRNLILNWSCTRELGHNGKHLAGTGQWVVAVHPATGVHPGSPNAAATRRGGAGRSP